MTASPIAAVPLRIAARRLPREASALRHEVRGFLAEQLSAGGFQPRCDSWLGGWDRSFSLALGCRGWLGMTIPTADGGHGRTALERFVVVEELLAAGAPVAAHWIADRQTGPALLRYGSPEQRRRYLPAISRGELAAAIGMSEPDAGSDLAGIRTRARKVVGGWKVTGSKVWTSGAHDADLLVALVRTGDADGDRHSGLSQLLIDLPRDGVTIRPIRLLTGEHHFNQIHLDEVFVPDDAILGEVGRGWEQVVAELAYERSGPERFLSTLPLLVELVRQLDGSANRQAASAVGGLVAQLWSLRQLSVGVACAHDQGKIPDVEAAVVKDLGTRLEQELVDVVRLVAGVEPSSTGTVLHMLLAEAILHSPGFTLRGGTSEILRTIIAKRVLHG
jgi:alkylation response protein AidB-like acyl-CoA dehydrogenase